MSLFKIFDVAGSAMLAQSQRLNATASNLANADSVAGPDGKAYKARQVVFETSAVSLSTPGSGAQAPVAPTPPSVHGAGYVISSWGKCPACASPVSSKTRAQGGVSMTRNIPLPTRAAT